RQAHPQLARRPRTTAQTAHALRPDEDAEGASAWEVFQAVVTGEDSAWSLIDGEYDRAVGGCRLAVEVAYLLEPVPGIAEVFVAQTAVDGVPCLVRLAVQRLAIPVAHLDFLDERSDLGIVPGGHQGSFLLVCEGEEHSSACHGPQGS